MIIFDNCVLSAFTRLNLLSQLKTLLNTALISKEIIEEYSIQWQNKLPNWIKVLVPNHNIPLEDTPISLSSADLSIIRLGLEHRIPIASDDKTLRQFAKNLGLSITGSLGLLKALYKNKIIKTKEEYLSFIESLQKDLFISEDLIKWALDE